MPKPPPTYNLEEVRELARRRCCVFHRQAENRFQALGYTSDDAMDVIASLSLDMFRKTHHYDNGTFDDYVGNFTSPGGDMDPLYIKLKIARKASNDEGLLVISFHRST